MAASNTSKVRKGAAMWLFRFLMRSSARAASGPHFDVLHLVQFVKEKYLHPTGKWYTTFLTTYAPDEYITNKKADFGNII